MSAQILRFIVMPLKLRSLKGIFSGAWRKCHFALLLLCTLFVSPGWAADPVWKLVKGTSTRDAQDAWVYAPSGADQSQLRPLLVVLHGCSQDAIALRDYGSVASAADRRGFIVAIPQVGFLDGWGPGCWDYDGARDGHGHIKELRALTETLLNPAAQLNVDPAKVFVAGISSGGTLSLLLGCAAPDIFSGVASIAGPAVGSDQRLALTPHRPNPARPNDGPGIPANTTDTAIETCRRLAGAKGAYLQRQVAHVAYGEMDRDGSSAVKHSYNPWLPFMNRSPGQYALVSVKWAEHNAEAFRTLYRAGAWSEPVSVSGGATERNATVGGRPRVSLLSIRDVGHAWPAGISERGGGGPWIHHGAFNYPDYIMGWFLKNGLR